VVSFLGEELSGRSIAFGGRSVERVGHFTLLTQESIMAKQSRVSQVFDVGFAEGYQGNPLDISRFSSDEVVHYEKGYELGGEHFDKVMEIMEVTGRSLREVHQHAINKLYSIVREQLLSS
jgi:hypothetical protein